MENNQEKEEKNKKKKNGPGHLKERNHFDAKDMILLVIMLVVIYGIMTWVDFFGQERANNLPQNQTTTESSQTETVENP
ncbi:MAG: hypothetical protein II477_06340 [Lachnospiraceae bacterium]|nr:hypothetical protein [Lachnospiraceae bacterium]MBQ3905751.1 hypothetical protein [Lachnospiraceae bacterium]